MAEIDTSTGRGGIPSGNTQSASSFKKEERVQTTQVPEMADSFRKFAEADNILSTIGSNVASVASNALAAKLGGSIGKNPVGDLSPPITDFDKHLAESYSTQAHATLGLEANKLITDSNLELAKVPRLSPDLIAKSQAKISQGLSKIYDQAPGNIRPSLESSYGAAQLSQSEQLTRRMVNEQHEDRRNNTILANDKNAEMAHSLAASGMYDQAMALSQTTASLNNSAVAGNIGFTPQQAKAGTDTVRQSAINGRVQHEYENSVVNKKEAEFMKNFATRPKWISDADYPAAQRSLMTYVNSQKAMKADYEQLTASEFQTKVAVDASSITASELQATLDKLSPINAQKVELAYIKGLKAQMQDKTEQGNLNQQWEDPTAQANSTPKVQNAVFNSKVSSAMEADPNLSREQAENQVARSAGGIVPVFTESLKNKLWSGDPAQMVTGVMQMNELRMTGSGHALRGLSDEDNALASAITHNYNPADPAWAARVVAENRENQDPTIRKQSEVAFSNFIDDNTRKKSTTSENFVLGEFGLGGGIFSSGFDSPWMKGKYSADIMSAWQTNFVNTRGDTDRAKALTKEYVDDNYGKTKFNGSSEWTMHPIEKACGFSEGDGLPSINKDVMRQVSAPMAKLKEAYDKGHSDEYWAIEESKPKANEGLQPFKQPGRQLQFVKHTRNGVSTDTQVYPLRLVGNNFNWELNVDTDHGPRSVFLEAPAIGVHTYTPDVKWIEADYLATGGR